MSSLVATPQISLEVHRLHISYAAVRPLHLPSYRGPVLRAAMIDALRDRFCVLRGGGTCGQEPTCQVCGLVAPSDTTNSRGTDMERPFALRPPLDNHTSLSPGDNLEFDLVLFGTATRYVPYLVLALKGITRLGLGHDREVERQLTLEEVWAINDLTGDAHRVHGARQQHITLPRVPITDTQVNFATDALPHKTVTLRICTPLRLVSDGALVHQLTFPVLIRRILGRLSALCSTYGSTPLDRVLGQLLSAADQVIVSEDATRWQDVASHSSRLNRATPIGGLVGSITFAGDLEPFLPWLVWGELVHIGKDTTKGNGWYRILTD